MKVTILYFAALRETLGLARETCDLPDGIATTGAVRAWLRERGGAWATALADGRAVRSAVDQRLAAADTGIHDGAEIAFFPPVTGG